MARNTGRTWVEPSRGVFHWSWAEHLGISSAFHRSPGRSSCLFATWPACDEFFWWEFWRSNVQGQVMLSEKWKLIFFIHTRRCGSTFNSPGNNFSNLCNHGSSGGCVYWADPWSLNCTTAGRWPWGYQHADSLAGPGLAYEARLRNGQTIIVDDYYQGIWTHGTSWDQLVIQFFSWLTQKHGKTWEKETGKNIEGTVSWNCLERIL